MRNTLAKMPLKENSKKYNNIIIFYNECGVFSVHSQFPWDPQDRIFTFFENKIPSLFGRIIPRKVEYR